MVKIQEEFQEGRTFYAKKFGEKWHFDGIYKEFNDIQNIKKKACHQRDL